MTNQRRKSRQDKQKNPAAPISKNNGARKGKYSPRKIVPESNVNASEVSPESKQEVGNAEFRTGDPQHKVSIDGGRISDERTDNAPQIKIKKGVRYAEGLREGEAEHRSDSPRQNYTSVETADSEIKKPSYAGKTTDSAQNSNVPMDGSGVDEKQSPEPKRHVFSRDFREFVKYISFLFIFSILIFGPRNSDSYYMYKVINDYFLANDFTCGGTTFQDLTTEHEFWIFMNDTMIPNLFPTESYSGAPLSKNKQNFLADGANYRLGAARLRTVRVRKGTCQIPGAFDGLVEDCYASYQDEYLQTSKYCPHKVETDDNSTTCWEYKKTKTPEYFSTITKISYSGDGYVEDMPKKQAETTLTSLVPTSMPTLFPTVSVGTPAPTEEDWRTYSQIAHSQVAELRRIEWIDSATRAIFIEFSVYNANTDIVACVRLAVEKLASGSLVTSSNIITAPLLTSYRALTNDGVLGSTYVIMIFEFVFYSFVIVYIVDEIREYFHIQKKRRLGMDVRYFAGWNLVDITNLSIFFVVMLFRIFLLLQVSGVKDKLLETHFLDDIQYTMKVKQWVDGLNSLNAVISFIKIFKYTAQHKKLGQFTKTVVKASQQMGSFVFVTLVVLFGYAIAFHIAFGHELGQYKDFKTSVLTLFQGLVGDFDSDSILNSNIGQLGTLLYLTYIFLMFFVIMSMLLSIIANAFDDVLEENEARTDVDPLTSDLSYIYNTPIRWFKQRFIGDVEVSTVAPMDSEPDNLDEISLDEAMESHDTFVAYAATYKKTLNRMAILQDSQTQLEDLFEAITKKLDLDRILEEPEIQETKMSDPVPEQDAKLKSSRSLKSILLEKKNKK